MMKSIAALCGLLFTLAPAAVAGADAIDDKFYDAVSSYGIPTTKPKAISEAHVVCTILREPGITPSMVNDATAQSNSDWSFADAAYFVGAAIASYCPQYGSEIGR